MRKMSEQTLEKLKSMDLKKFNTIVVGSEHSHGPLIKKVKCHVAMLYSSPLLTYIADGGKTRAFEGVDYDKITARILEGFQTDNLKVAYSKNVANAKNFKEFISHTPFSIMLIVPGYENKESLYIGT